ncbi:MAG: hypothetical protein SF069_14540 [Phycisphaerae bacterium]|nr:hypothetical protein [Phycisphaerae bacterium]
MNPNNADIPRLCDFSCPFAAFPPAETAGICRTMSAVQCGKLLELVNKNAPCEWRKRQGAASTDAGKTKGKPARPAKRRPRGR